MLKDTFSGSTMSRFDAEKTVAEYKREYEKYKNNGYREILKK